MADPKDDAVNAAKKYLDGLKSRPRQPWDDIAGGPPAEPSQQPTPPPPPRPAGSTADDAMSQAERIAKRNRDIAEKTRYLRKD